MREPINGAIVKDDLLLAMQGYDIALELLGKYGAVPMVKYLLDYYKEAITRLMLTGMAFGL